MSVVLPETRGSSAESGSTLHGEDEAKELIAFAARRLEEYLAWDPYAGDKDAGPVEALTSKIVRTRKPQTCVATEETHDISAGSLARRDKALYDGKWASWYACLDCIDRELGYGERLGS